jgi:Tol biopolymer transport system component
VSFSLRGVLGLGLAILATVVVLVALRASTSDLNSPRPSAPTRPATSALYLSGDSLARLELGSGELRRIGRSPTRDVFASNSGSWLAYVVSGGTAAEEHDFLLEPILQAINLDSGDKVELGPGFSPLWHPTAAKLAYLRPVGSAQCSGEGCSGLFDVVVHDMQTSMSSVLAEGRYSLLGWSDDRVLVADQNDLSTTRSLGPRGDAEPLDVAPSELWDASPDGRWLLKSASEGVTLVDTRDGRQRSIEVEGVLGDGAWSPDSRYVAVGVLNDARTRTHAVLIDVDDGEVTEITPALPGILDLTWGPDSRQFAFLTFVGRSNRTELSLCSTEGRTCEIVGEPQRRTILLRLE